MGADLGALFDRAADRLLLIDEQGVEIPPDRALLLLVHLLASAGAAGRSPCR
jgi:phosphomannomutase